MDAAAASPRWRGPPRGLGSSATLNNAHVPLKVRKSVASRAHGLDSSPRGSGAERTLSGGGGPAGAAASGAAPSPLRGAGARPLAGPAAPP